MSLRRGMDIAVPVVALVLALAACGQQEPSAGDEPAAVPTSSAPSPSEPPSPSAPANPSTPAPSATGTAPRTSPGRFVVAPPWVGRLRAGMRLTEARRIGLARLGPVEGCDVGWQLTDPDISMAYEIDMEPLEPLRRADIDRLETSSRKHHTEKGVGPGSTLADLERAYEEELWNADDTDAVVQARAVTSPGGSVVFVLDVAPGRRPTATTRVAYVAVVAEETKEGVAENLLGFDSDPC